MGEDEGGRDNCFGECEEEFVSKLVVERLAEGVRVISGIEV